TPSGHHHSGIPAGRPSVEGWSSGPFDYAGSIENPCHHGVRVPHIASPELVPSPDGTWHLGEQVQDLPDNDAVIGDPDRAGDCIAEVRDRAVGPAAELVAEDPEPAQQAAPDRALPYYPPLLGMAVSGDGRH